MKNSMMERTMSKSHMEGSTDHSVPQADFTKLQSQESTSKVHKHDSLINKIREQELHTSILETYEQKFSDSTKTYENKNKQEAQSSGTKGHEHDNLINGIRERELHTPILEAYERILGDSTKTHENKNKQEIQPSGPEVHERRIDDFIQVQFQESISKRDERSTDTMES